MGFCIRRRIPFTLYTFTAYNINNNHVLRTHTIVVNTRWLNYHVLSIFRYATYIAPRVDYHALSYKI